MRRETYRFFRGDLSLPSRIILLDGSGTISFDVLSWLAEQEVPLVRIDWQGHVQTVLGNAGYAANPHRVAWQIETRADPRKRMAFCIDLIGRKIEACIRTLEKSVRRSPAWERAMERAYADLTRLECDPPRRHRVLAGIRSRKRGRVFSSLASCAAEMGRHGAPSYSGSSGGRSARGPHFISSRAIAMPPTPLTPC